MPMRARGCFARIPVRRNNPRFATFSMPLRANAATRAGSLSRRALSSTVQGRAQTPLTELLTAAAKGDASTVAAIVDAHPATINERGTLPGHTGLRTALHFGVRHEAVVSTLLDRGANPNIRDEGDNAYPIHFAAEQRGHGGRQAAHRTWRGSDRCWHQARARRAWLGSLLRLRNPRGCRALPACARRPAHALFSAVAHGRRGRDSRTGRQPAPISISGWIGPIIAARRCTSRSSRTAGSPRRADRTWSRPQHRGRRRADAVGSGSAQRRTRDDTSAASTPAPHQPRPPPSSSTVTDGPRAPGSRGPGAAVDDEQSTLGAAPRTRERPRAGARIGDAASHGHAPPRWPVDRQHGRR